VNGYDQAIDGGYQSHLEMYLEAMEAAGADTSRIIEFMKLLAQGDALPVALKAANVPGGAAEFVMSTFRIIEIDQPHAVASAFTFGREDLIPDMFRHLVKDLATQTPNRLTRFDYYLDRHIHLDEEEHGPMALQLVSELCNDSTEAWKLAAETARTSLRARKSLWDSVEQVISGRNRSQGG